VRIPGRDWSILSDQRSERVHGASKHNRPGCLRALWPRGHSDHRVLPPTRPSAEASAPQPVTRRGGASSARDHRGRPWSHAASVGVILMAHRSRPRGHVDTRSTPPIATGTCLFWVDMITPQWHHDDRERRPDILRGALTTLRQAGALVRHVVARPAGAPALRSGFLRSVPLCTL
jgi:hypothetical protein